MDEELERIKRKKFLELQKRLMTEEKEQQVELREPTPEEILSNNFVGRAWEVYSVAKIQYPRAMNQVEQALVEGIKSGKIVNKIDGESLFQFEKDS